MVLLRRVIGDALRARRQGQHRTLREVSTAANVSLGYLSEIERGQKEASSELLASICDALGAQLSEVLREASDTLAFAEAVDGVLAPVNGSTAESAGTDTVRTGDASAGRVPAGPATATPRRPIQRAQPVRPAHAQPAAKAAQAVQRVTDGNVSVAVRQPTPLKATLRATRSIRPEDRGREVVYAA
jgi:XRE family transcriptional regulator, stress-response regulator